MGTIISKPGGGTQVGYKGFKYNVSTYGYPAAPGPGQALIYEGCGEECYYAGFYMHRYDANGTDIYSILINLKNQPFTIVDSSGVVTLNAASGVQLVGDYFSILGLAPISGSGIWYFDFNPGYGGYIIPGSLNGATLTTGTYYLSPGATTASTDPVLRSISVPVTVGKIEAFVLLAGTSSTMTINLMINGVAVTPYFSQPFPAGVTAGTFPLCLPTPITNNSSVNIRIIQGAGVSYQIHGFYYKII